MSREADKAEFWRKQYNTLLKEHTELKKAYKAQLKPLYGVAKYYAEKHACKMSAEALKVVLFNPL